MPAGSRRTALQLVLTACLAAWPAVAQAETRPTWPSVVTIRLMPPLSEFLTDGHGSSIMLAGGSLAWLARSWIEANLGGGWGLRGPNGGTGAGLHAFLGASQAILDRRLEPRAPWTLRWPVLIGYRLATFNGHNESGDRQGGISHVMSSNLGFAVSYWFSPAVGVEARALADVGVVLAGTSVDEPGLVYGWTASLGLSIVSESRERKRMRPTPAGS